MKITPIERQLLVNQYKILGSITKDSSYFESANILESGASIFYNDALSIKDEIPEDIQNETMDIFDMFDNINKALDKINDSDKSQLNLSRLTFDGFDQRDDKHYGFHEFLHSINRYNYIKLKNSHGPRLPKYRLMLKEFKKNEPLDLISFEILKKLSEIS